MRLGVPAQSAADSKTVPSHCGQFAPFNYQKQRSVQTNKGVQQQHAVGFFVRGNCRGKKIMYAKLLYYYLSQNTLEGGKLVALKKSKMDFAENVLQKSFSSIH